MTSIRGGSTEIGTSLEAWTISLFCPLFVILFWKNNHTFLTLLVVVIQDFISNIIWILVRDKPLNLKRVLKAYGFIPESKIFFFSFVQLYFLSCDVNGTPLMSTRNWRPLKGQKIHWYKSLIWSSISIICYITPR